MRLALTVACKGGLSSSRGVEVPAWCPCLQAQSRGDEGAMARTWLEGAVKRGLLKPCIEGQRLRRDRQGPGHVPRRPVADGSSLSPGHRHWARHPLGLRQHLFPGQLRSFSSGNQLLANGGTELRGESLRPISKSSQRIAPESTRDPQARRQCREERAAPGRGSAESPSPSSHSSASRSGRSQDPVTKE